MLRRKLKMELTAWDVRSGNPDRQQYPSKYGIDPPDHQADRDSQQSQDQQILIKL